MNFVFAIILWLTFGFIHSLMARPHFKKIINKKIGEIFEKYFYRFFYFITQCIIFYFIYGIIKNLDPGNILLKIPENFDKIYFVFYIFSNLFLIISVLQFDISEFIGVSQIIKFFKKSKKNNQKLNSSFLYKYIRHPMYLGIILVYISSHTIFTQLFFINLISLIVYIEIGSYYEEKTLVEKFGENYSKYQNSTYKYFPFVR